MSKVNLNPTPSEIAWSTELNNEWDNCLIQNVKPLPVLIRMLSEFYTKSDQPYQTVLYLMLKSHDFHKSKPKSLCFTILITFEDWLSRQDKSKLNRVLNESVQMTALHVASKQSNLSLSRKILELFELRKNSKTFIPIIQDFIVMKKFKEVCFIVMCLALDDLFSLEDFIIPLVLQDKVQIVEEYLLEFPGRREELVSYLDKWNGDAIALDMALAKLDVPDIRHDKLRKKTLSKLITRYLKIFKLDPTCCPNTTHLKGRGAMNYLLGKHDEAKGSDSNWEDLIPDAVGDDVKLQTELVYSLACSNDYTAAKKWFNNFNLTLDKFPSSVQERLNSSESNVDESEDWDMDADSNFNEYSNDAKRIFYSLTLSEGKIMIVKDLMSFEKFLKDILQREIVAIDAEWKPSLGFKRNRMSIMQIAVYNQIYILDLLNLTRQLEIDDWINLIDNVFNNQRILKIGFGFKSDLQMLAYTIPEVESKLKNLVNFVELNTLIPNLVKNYSYAFKADLLTPSGSCKSLSNVIQAFFEYPLCKAEQFSDWEKRPLRDTQITYAALDAFCLLEIYEHILMISLRYNIDLLLIIKETNEKSCIKIPKVKKKKVKTTIDFSKLKIDNDSNVPIDFVFICDLKMIQLAKCLRACGFDTKVMDFRSWCVDEAKNTMRRSGYFLVSDSKEYFCRLGSVPCKQLIYIPEKAIEDQFNKLVKIVDATNLKKYSKSRCYYCNCDSFIRMPHQFMKALHHLQRPNSTANVSPTKRPVGRGRIKPKVSKDNDELIVGMKEFDGGNVNMVNGTIMESGAKIKASNVEIGNFKCDRLFHVCDECGEVFWRRENFGEGDSVVKFFLNEKKFDI